MTQARQKQSRVTRARGDIQHARAGRQLQRLDGGAHVLHVFQNVSVPVAMTSSGELLLRRLLNCVKFHAANRIPCSARVIST